MDQHCDKCKKLIKHGSNYVTITREIEHFSDDLQEGSEVVSVIDAEQIIILCTTCGDNFKASKVKQIITQSF